MRHRNHAALVNAVVGLRQHLFPAAMGDEAEAFATRPPHAHNVPFARTIELVVFLEEERENLVAGQRVRRTSSRRHDRIGVGAVRDDRCVTVERYLLTFRHNGGGAGPYISAIGAFGRRGGKQHLVHADAPQTGEIMFVLIPMVRDASDIGGVHCVDHRCRRTHFAERVTNLRSVGDASSFAAKCRG